jgi:Protein of unknown function (DUF4013)
MLFGFNLNDVVVFPIEDSEARKHFLVGCLIYLTGFFIPILPWLITSGYSAIIVRQVLNGEKPHLVPWDNWEGLLKDGARLFGIALVYSIPLLILMITLFTMLFAFPLFSISIQDSHNQGLGILSVIFVILSTGIFILMFPLSIAIGLIVPVAEIHAIAKDDFTAGFRVSEWWPIFKTNWGGFVVAFAIGYAIFIVMSFAMQILFFTIILICIFPIFIAAISIYYAFVQFAMFAQAYKEGNDKLNVEVETAVTT